MSQPFSYVWAYMLFLILSAAINNAIRRNLVTRSRIAGSRGKCICSLLHIANASSEGQCQFLLLQQCQNICFPIGLPADYGFLDFAM
jgi:hypothetical protein